MKALLCTAVDDNMKSGCLCYRSNIYIEEVWIHDSEERRLQYIYKQAFDHLPCAVPQDSIQDNTECTTMVNIALVEINKYDVDTVFVSPVNTPQQGW
jgi:hypothetical protein